MPNTNASFQPVNLGRFQYTGQIWLPEIGIYYYKARIYSPTLGRFMQTDPVGYDDQMNLYAYVGNDPANATDPTGLDTCIDGDGKEIICVIAGEQETEKPDPFESLSDPHNYLVPWTVVCEGAECNKSKVDSLACNVPGHAGEDKPIENGAAYFVNIYVPICGAGGCGEIKVPNGVINAYKSSNGMNFANVTSLFHPLTGRVDRQYVQGHNGDIIVRTFGTGKSGISPVIDRLNDVIGPAIFERANYDCSQQISQ